MLHLIRRVGEVIDGFPICAIVAAPKDAVLKAFTAIIVLTINNLLNLVFFFVVNNKR